MSQLIQSQWTFVDNRDYPKDKPFKGNRGELLKMLQQYLPKTKPQNWHKNQYSYNIISPHGKPYRIYIAHDSQWEIQKIFLLLF